MLNISEHLLVSPVSRPLLMAKNESCITHYKEVIDQLMNELNGAEIEALEYRSLLHSLPYPILITSAKSKIIYVNPAWVNITGFRSEEVIGKHPHKVNQGKTPPKYNEKLKKAISSGKVFTSDEVINKRKDGSEYPIHNTIFPVFRDGKINFFVQIFEDISERKKIEQIKMAFLSTIAHELKTPITTLKLLSEVLLQRLHKLYPDDATIRDETKIMTHELDRLTGLINDLLDVSRIETGKITINPASIDLVKIIEDSIYKMHLINNEYNIKYSGPDKIEILADSNRIEQVISNLLSNAIKHSPQSHQIEVRAQTSNHKVTVEVQDYGTGISKAHLPHIFDMFYQVEDNQKNGFGLGLFISREIIKRHHGKISVKSQPANGSTFFFTLPL